MWINKRVLKKHHKTNKKLVFFLCFFGIGTIAMLLYSSFILFQLLSPQMLLNPIPNIRSVLGKKIDQDTLQTEVANALREKNISFNTVEKVDDSSVKVTLDGKEEVFFTTNKDISSQITSLQVIITRTTMEGRHFTKLDLRFDKPVIVFK